MKNKSSLENKTTRIIRKIALIISLVLIVLTLGFAIPSLVSDPQPPSIILILTGIFMLGGLALSWKWELIGALISLVGFIGVGILNPDAMQMPMMYLFPLTAILFLICWWLRKSQNSKVKNIGYGD